MEKEIYLIGETELIVKYRFQKEQFKFLINDNEYTVQLIETKNNDLRLEINGLQYQFHLAQNGNDYFIHNEDFGNIHLVEKERFPIKVAEKVKGGYETPMPSQIIKILVEVGQTVKAGDSLVILSSMKMENTIEASEDGVVEEIYAAEGSSVEAGFLLLKITGNG